MFMYSMVFISYSWFVCVRCTDAMRVGVRKRKQREREITGQTVTNDSVMLSLYWVDVLFIYCTPRSSLYADCLFVETHVYIYLFAVLTIVPNFKSARKNSLFLFWYSRPFVWLCCPIALSRWLYAQYNAALLQTVRLRSLSNEMRQLSLHV